MKYKENLQSSSTQVCSDVIDFSFWRIQTSLLHFWSSITNGRVHDVAYDIALNELFRVNRLIFPTFGAWSNPEYLELLNGVLGRRRILIRSGNRFSGNRGMGCRRLEENHNLLHSTFLCFCFGIIQIHSTDLSLQSASTNIYVTQ